MINLNSLTKNIKDGFKAPTGDSNRETPTKGALRFNTETGKPEIYAKGRGWRRASVSEISAIYTHDNLVAFYDASNADTTGDTSDQYYSDVSLLLHMNGTDGSTTFTDSSSTNKSVTVVGSADISTDQFKFGGSSYNCNLGNGNSIYLNNSGGVFGFSGQNYWTIETWFYRTATGNQTLMSNYGNSSTGWTIQIVSEKLIINLSGDGNDIAGTTTLSTNTWHHIALVNNNGTYTAYLNGTSEGAKTGSVNLTGGSRLAIGNFPYGGGFTQTGPGYMDEIRITNNIARYTADFTPQTREFYPGTAVSDITSNDNDGFLVGNANLENSSSPFYYEFNDGNDAIRLNEISNFQFGTGDFSLISWVYFTDAADHEIIYSSGSGSGAGVANSMMFYRAANNFGYNRQLGVWIGTSNYYGTTQIPDNTWAQAALVRNGDTVKFYINSSEAGSSTGFASDSADGAKVHLGTGINGTDYALDGRIAIFKVYDSALSSADITSEFNYHKSTFGL